jgi:hypothetical protein
MRIAVTRLAPHWCISRAVDGSEIVFAPLFVDGKNKIGEVREVKATEVAQLIESTEI